MAERPSPDDIEHWQRWFAVECNNQAWDLVERRERTDAEDLQMLHAAHAAAHHWSRVGTAHHAALADLLLGHVHASLGQATAGPYARRAGDYILKKESADWEIAMAHAVLAHAAAAAGDAAAHAAAHAAAVRAGEAIADAEDRGIFEAMFATVPTP